MQLFEPKDLFFGPVRFTTHLTPDYREALEQLFFFNPAQSVYLPAIQRAVDEFGVPEIQEANGRLILKLRSTESGALFMLRDWPTHAPLLGTMLYARAPLDTLSVIHLAVAERPERSGKERRGFGGLLVAQAIDMAKRIRGVTYLNLPYRRGRLCIR
jgi:hypothetical protein